MVNSRKGSFPRNAYHAACAWWNRRSRFLRVGMVLLPVMAGLTALLLPMSIRRLIDGDEGYLLMAARLVSEGKIPYRDFFLPQGPFLPAFFGTCFLAIGRSWLGARMVAGMLAVLMGLLVYQGALSATRRHSAAAFATALFAFSGTTLGWLTIVKGYGVSTLGMLLSLGLVQFAANSAAGKDYKFVGNLFAMGAGVAMGVAASSRLYTILIMPALALYLVRNLGLTRQCARRLGLYALGCFLGLLPLLVTYALDRKAFLFDTFLFHGVREYGQSSLFGKLSDKAPVIASALGIHAKASIESRQLLALLILAILALLARIPSRNTCRSAAAWVWPVLLLASILPNPFLPQYLCMLVPFLAIEGGFLLGALLDGLSRRKAVLGVAAMAICALVFLGHHISRGWEERHRYLHTGIDVPGVWTTDRVPRWQIQTVEAVAKAIDAQNIPEAASWWPGYFISSRTHIALPLANDFGFRAAQALSPQERLRFHVVSHADVGDMIRQRNPRLFVAGNWTAYPYANWLAQNGYQVRSTIQNVSIWTVP